MVCQIPSVAPSLAEVGAVGGICIDIGTLQLTVYYVVVPSLQEHCTGRCGSYTSINVTVPESVIIPCGDVQLSNTSTVDYCNATGGGDELLREGATTLYNLTTTEIGHQNNVIYCTDNQNIFCYSLIVFCKDFYV